MIRGGKSVNLAMMLAVAGCTSSEGQLQIRPTPAPISGLSRPVPYRIAEAQGHFALGNVALALESYRKAARDEPQNVDALAGIAACYDRMGRFELSRRYFEAALAVAPTDPRVLGALATSLDTQGRGKEAASVRQEVAARAVPAEPSVTTLAAVTRAAVQPKVPGPPPSQSVTVMLPAAPLAMVAPASAAPVETQAVSAPAPSPFAALIEAAASAANSAPRLERLSLGEVALLTSTAPPARWRAQLVRQTARSSTVRFVPLRAQARVNVVRLLNAARSQGLAARTRQLLMKNAGWERIVIGDAARVREKSLVLYSADSEGAARLLAKRFGFALAREPRRGALIVLLGRDAVLAARAKG